MSKAYIINTGIISAIGKNTSENHRSLKEERHGIAPASILETHWSRTFPVGEVKLNNLELAQITGMKETLPRTALLSAVAVQEAIQPLAGKLDQFRVGFLSANTVGGMDLSENFYKDYINGEWQNKLDKVRHHECGTVTELVADHFGLDGFATTISTACSSSANSIMMAARMIESGMLDMAVAGGADALSRFTLNGFNTLMILDKEFCQPMDQNRRGLNLGEGAAYLLLVSEQLMQEMQLKPIAVLSGYANANDAFHQTASSPEGNGNKLSMNGAMAQAGIQPADVSYINLHGTGTANNDSSEGIAVASVFGNKIPPASSTKAYTGHTLGAAGAVEAVYAVLSIQHQEVYPNLRWHTPIEGFDWKPVTAVTPSKIDHVLSNSFGFGGNCSSLVISKA